MIRYIAQRVVAYIVVIFVVSLGTFYMIHLLPGNPAIVILGAAYTPQNIAKLNKLLGFNKPIYVQYFIWLKNLLHGNFGTSFITGISVRTTISSALLVDIQLILLSQVMALGIAIPIAFRSARKPGGFFDLIATSTSFVLLAIPGFVSITVLVDILALHLHVPYTTPYSYHPGGDWLTNVYAMLLPAFVIALGSFVIYYRVLRSDLISTYQEEFITMARSKGLSRRRIVWRHAFRPSSIALLGTAGLVVSGLVAGTFIVEFLTGLPGMGFTLLTADSTSDYLVVQAISLVVATAVLVLNFGIDMIFAVVDPRITRG